MSIGTRNISGLVENVVDLSFARHGELGSDRKTCSLLLELHNEIFCDIFLASITLELVSCSILF